ncbi:MAG TPA: hypothetical protein VFM73_07745 [Xanthomonadaceae bacterium]|nr:hypothetical protein [Xanthomonadaceae bacterium]
MRARQWVLAGSLLGLALQGCDAAPADAAGRVDAVALPDGVEAGAPATERLFSGEVLEGEGCVLLSIEDVSAATGIDATEISTNPAMDCFFSWEGGQVVLMWPSIHRSIEQASEQYAGFTQDLSAADMQAGIADLGKRLDAKAAAGDITDRQASAATALAGSQAGLEVRNTDVAGVGDEASHDGNRLKVRVGNVILDVTAKRDDEFDLELTKAVANRVVHNLEQRGER